MKRHPLAPFALLVLLMSALACSSNDAPNDGDATPDATIDASDTAPSDATEPVTLPLTLESGATRLVVSEDGSFELLRGEETLLRFPVGGLELGRVPEIESDRNYDPTYLEAGQFGGDLAPKVKDLRWEASGAIVAFETRPDGADFMFSLGEDSTTLAVTISAEDRFLLHWHGPSEGDLPVFFRLRPRADAEENFYGLGQVSDTVTHRGKIRAMQHEFSDLESGYNETHVPVPLLLGTRGWGMLVESFRPGVFAVATDDDEEIRATFGLRESHADGLRIHLFTEDHPIDLVKHHYAITGQPGGVAPWALGPWIWRDEIPGQVEVEQDLQTIRDLDLATTGYWIDRPYATAVNSFDFKPSDYPDPEAMMALAGDLGFQMALWHTPYVDPDDAISEDLAAVAQEAGYFAPVLGAYLDKWGPPIDFTNPDAFAWWQSNLGPYRDLGITGYKLDYAEEVVVGLLGVRVPWEFHDGSNELTMHRGIQLLYHQVYREMLPEEGGFLLCRAAAFGDQSQGVIIWPGDIDAMMTLQGETIVNEDGVEVKAVGGLPTAVIQASSLGASGFPLFAADTGGYLNTPPSKETFVRWFQQSAFSPAMQVGTNSNDLPWAFGKDKILDEEMLGWYRDMARIHLRLHPYLWTHFKAIPEHGRPIQRALGLAHPELGVHPDDIYLLGDDLLVAPVVREGVTEREIPLPEGEWVDWWTGERIAGGTTATRSAPLDTIPVLLRAGGMIPMLRPTIDTWTAGAAGKNVDAFEDDPNPLHVLTTPADSGSLTVYDGTALSLATEDGSLTLTRTPGSLFDGHVIFEVIGAGEKPASVQVDGEDATEVTDLGALSSDESGWMFSEERGGTIWVQLGSSSAQMTLK